MNKANFLRLSLLVAFLGTRVIAYDYSTWKYSDFAELGMEYAGAHNDSQALFYFDKAVQADPKNPESYVNRGAVLIRMGRLDKGTEDEKQALTLAGSGSADDKRIQAYAHQNLGKVYQKNKQIKQAEKELRAAANLRGEDPVILEDLADVLAAEGNAEEPIALLQKAQTSYRTQKNENNVAALEVKIGNLRQRAPRK